MESYILCQESKENSKFFLLKVEEKIINKLKFSQIHNKCLLKNTVDDKSLLNIMKKYNNNKKINIQFDKENTQILVIPELNEDELLFYISDGKSDEYDIKTFLKILTINLYYQNSLSSFDIKKRMTNILLNIDTFWERFNVSKINLTNNFRSKRFNLSVVAKNKEQCAQIETDYLNEIKDYVENIKQEKVYYTAEFDTTMNYEYVSNIYNILNTEYMKYTFLVTLLCSKKHCHLVLKNKELLINSKPIFDKYKIAFKYFMSYAWMTFICAELFSYNIEDDDVYVLDLDTANLLPKYPFTFNDINQNPYACFFVDKNALNVEENLLSTDCDVNYELYNGVTTCKEFSRRLNIFCNGINEKKYLDYIDWSCCAITGSVFYTCVMNGYQAYDYDNEIYDREVNKENNLIYSDETLKNYYNENNPNSDIDIICNKDDYFEFSTVIHDLYEKIKADKNETEITKITSTILIVTNEFIINEFTKLKKHLIDNNKKRKDGKDYTEYTVDQVKIYDENVNEYFYTMYYNEYKNKINKKYDEFLEEKYCDLNIIEKIKKSDTYNLFREPSVLNFRLKMFTYEPTIENLNVKDTENIYYNKDKDKILAKMSESTRYKIDIPDSRTFEIFKSRRKSFFSTIGSFHFSMVRGFWNGKTCKILPSASTSSMINLSHEYKYFASGTHPAVIVNKYRKAGSCGVLCNLNGRRDIALYICENKDKFENLGLDDIEDNDNKVATRIKKIFGLYRENKYGRQVKTFEENFNNMTIQEIGFMNTLKGISDNGSVIPLNKSYINIFYEKINENYFRNNNNNNKNTIENKD